MVSPDAQSNSATTSGVRLSHLKTGGDIPKKPVFLTYAEPPLGVLERNQWYHRMRNPIPQQLQGVRLSHLKTGGDILKKPVFLTYAGPSLGVLETIQGYHQMRNPIPQQLQGVRLSHLKTGGRYPQKTCFSHICRASPGRARE